MSTKSLAVCFVLIAISLSDCAPPGIPTVEAAPIPSSPDSVVEADETGFCLLPAQTGIAEVDALLALSEVILAPVQ